MESTLRHILHFSNGEVDASGNERPQLDRTLSVDELSQVADQLENAPLNGNENGDGILPGRKRSNPSSRLSYPRKRAIRACQKCRVRRTKCDNVRPSCTACIDLGAECVYSEGDPSTCGFLVSPAMHRHANRN